MSPAELRGHRGETQRYAADRARQATGLVLYALYAL